MSAHAIYIPTRDRLATITKSAPAALRHGFPVYVVSEPQFKYELADAMREHAPSANLITLRRNNAGVGYARDMIARHAARNGYDSIVMCDDDQRLKFDVAGWLKLALRDDVMGIGAWKSIYGLYNMGTEMAIAAQKAHRAGLFLNSGQYGHAAVALNVANLTAIGGYRHINAWEDTYIYLRGAVDYGIPWYVYTGAEASNLLSQQKARRMGHSAGGVADFRNQREWDRSRDMLHTVIPGCVLKMNEGRAKLDWRGIVREHIGVDEWPLGNVETHHEWDWCPSDS